MYKQRIFQVMRLFLVVAVILSAYFFLKYTMVYLYPIIVAIILSFMFNPVVTFMEKKGRLPRAIAVAAVMIGFFTVIISSIILIITEIIQGTTYLAEIIPAHFITFITYIENFLETEVLPLYHKIASFFHTLDPDQQQAIQQNIQQLASEIASSGTAILQHLLLKIPAALRMLPTSFAILTFIVLATFFITKDWFSLKQTFQKLIPLNARDSGREVWNHLKHALSGFFKAQIILITITGITIFVGLQLIRIDHALTIAFIAAAVDLFPYIGTGIIFIPWIIYLFLTENYSMTISLSILYMVIIVGRQFLEPKLLSASIGVNPLAVLIAVFLGMQVWGVFGLIIAPIVLVLLNALQQSGVFRQLGLFIKG
ncbi:sporulation integral membrane protein YtvI [Virgibacillus dakarensis]|uniref:Sporulation integral membrane protein YtvI n=1 Tax=Lentibacillus populi TaxID=1827502 RepID=A0A9W5TTW6_9BACI|nr:MULTISPECIES: sporulation integral membrane protein YtvI [Bacillaceae]MTW84284.1 sporulation integral membrane protein YtvI [Virgibacillus dakarensis]GGB27632.1 sporulation integral membrane protein YtvI [Lentibacillus populi]